MGHYGIHSADCDQDKKSQEELQVFPIQKESGDQKIQQTVNHYKMPGKKVQGIEDGFHRVYSEAEAPGEIKDYQDPEEKMQSYDFKFFFHYFRYKRNISNFSRGTENKRGELKRNLFWVEHKFRIQTIAIQIDRRNVQKKLLILILFLWYEEK